MPSRRRLTLWAGIALALSAAAAFVVFPKGRHTILSQSAGTIDDKTRAPELNAALREGDARALAVLLKRSESTAEQVHPDAYTPEESAAWIEALGSARTGFLRFSSYGRVTAVTIVGRVFRRLAAEPAPADWPRALPPSHDILTAALADSNLDVRVNALLELSKLWSWTPGRSVIDVEEDQLADWKDGFRNPVVRRLTDREPRSRASAIACLAALPIDSAAFPAIAYLNDPNPAVRKQVMISFAARPTMLTEDAILKHMHDNEENIPEVADIVLKARGLNEDQISLGSMIFHPKPEMRASVFALLKNRTDVDPSVWLLQLSHDADEAVRVGAVEALSQRLTPEVGQRLAEMAATDQSATVRRAASKHLPEIMKTASLPPLPGSASLNPKAN